VERFPYVIAPSAAALAALHARAQDVQPAQDANVRVVAFADPAPTTLAPLPWARAEVRGIERAFHRKVRSHLGADATEEKVEAIGGRVPYLHFAVHGLLDSRSPLDSALVLAADPDAGRNGLLQAWEVVERSRIDADLVVLSGCETALGEARAGEGLVGLVRAFQFAGARAVVASQWLVSDRGTAVLMARLYHHLESGAPPSEALRAAQLELLRAAPGVRTALADLAPRHPRQWLASLLNSDSASSSAVELERLRHAASWSAFQVYGADR
jgi:CHAT domain-containing protein